MWMLRVSFEEILLESLCVAGSASALLIHTRTVGEAFLWVLLTSVLALQPPWGV